MSIVWCWSRRPVRGRRRRGTCSGRGSCCWRRMAGRAGRPVGRSARPSGGPDTHAGLRRCTPHQDVDLPAPRQRPRWRCGQDRLYGAGDSVSRGALRRAERGEALVLADWHGWSSALHTADVVAAALTVPGGVQRRGRRTAAPVGAGRGRRAGDRPEPPRAVARDHLGPCRAGEGSGTIPSNQRCALRRRRWLAAQ